MLTVRLDTSRLSDEEIAHVVDLLRTRCAHCIEEDVAPHRRHASEVLHFLDGLATALERERTIRAGLDPRVVHRADATGVP